MEIMMNPLATPATDRFPFLTRDDLPSEEARAVWDMRCKQIHNTFVGGHFNVMMHSPKLCERVSELEGYFRFDSSLDKHDRELITCVVLRKAAARYAWARHEQRAIQDGVPADVIELLRNQAPLSDFPLAYRSMVEFARTLTLATEELPRELFDRMLKAKGERWVMDAIALVGHYSLVAVTIHGYGIRAREEVDGRTF
jgi:alkylhydroperoxidase family enzyme